MVLVDGMLELPAACSSMVLRRRILSLSFLSPSSGRDNPEDCLESKLFFV